MACANLMRRCMRWMVVLCVCATIYVLSVGPATYLIVRTGSGQEIAQIAYAPLIWIDENALKLEALREYDRYFMTLADEADR